MKKNKENKISINNLIYALLFLVLGFLLLTSTEDIISIASKTIGGILVIIGLVKSIVYIYQKGKLGKYPFQNLIIGLALIAFGVMLIICAGAFSFAIRLVVGFFALFMGVNRIIIALSFKKYSKKSFWFHFAIAFVMILVGCLLVSGIFDKIIGLFIIFYAIAEIVDYIYFKANDKDIVKANEGNLKQLQDTKVVDAIIEEKEN